MQIRNPGHQGHPGYLKVYRCGSLNARRLIVRHTESVSVNQQ